MGLRVIGIDLNNTMLEKAKQNQADATFNPLKNPKYVREIRAMTKSRGCHAAAVFSDANAAYETAQRVLAFNGLLMIVGLPEKPLAFPAFAISTNLFRVKGASNGTAAEMKKAIEFTSQHQVVPEVEFRSLDEMPQMWNEMAQGKASKKMVVLFGNNKSKL